MNDRNKELLEAASYGHDEMVNLLLDAGANPEMTDEEGWNALHWAIKKGHFSTVELILNRRPDLVNTSDSQGKSPLHLAAEADELRIVRLLVDHYQVNLNSLSNDGDEPTPLLAAAANGNNEIVEFLLNKGANPEVIGRYGWNVLHHMVFQGYVPVVEFLLAHYPFLASKTDLRGNYPVHAVAPSGNNNLSKWLVFHAAEHEKLIEIENIDIIPGADTLEILANKLITSLLYENNRGNGKKVERIKEYLCYIDINYQAYTISGFNKLISTKETEDGTFFGSYISETSDSEEEKEFGKKSVLDRTTKFKVAENFAKKATREEMLYERNPPKTPSKEKKPKRKKKTSTLQKEAERKELQSGLNKGDLKIAEKEPRDLFNFSERPHVARPAAADLGQVELDLGELNQLAVANKDFTKEDIDALGLKTKFLIAQYRGITYMTTRWSKPQRMRHRQISETQLPVFCEAAYKRANLALDALYDEENRVQYVTELTGAAHDIAKMLLKLRSPEQFKYQKRLFICLGDLLQQIYTTNYDNFHKLLREDKYLKRLFPEGKNPFVSTADRPYHALKYAYGIKPYPGHEHERLRPRWRKNGRAERPYSGKVYVSLHPLTDYGVNGPTHVPSLNTTARVVVNTDIIAEYETTFPALISANRTIHTHVAKYLSFEGSYKTIYLYKYGLTPKLYEKFKEALKKYPPHTPGNKSTKRLLGEWLCAYHELRLIEIAKKEAEAQNGVLIYRTLNDGFSLELGPSTLVHSSAPEEKRAVIKEKRSGMKLAQHFSSPTPVSAENVEKMLSELMSGLRVNPEKMDQKTFARHYKAKRTDFSNVQFEENMDFSGLYLCEFIFSGATLVGAIFNEDTDLKNTNFDSACLENADFSKCNLENTIFTHITAHNVKFLGSNLQAVDFSGATLSGAIFDSLVDKMTNLPGTDFSGTHLERASFKSTGQYDINFCGTLFDNAHLMGAKFIDCELSVASFEKADISHSHFKDCILHSDKSSGVLLPAASFDNATVTGAIFENVKWHADREEDDNGDDDQDANFQNVKGRIRAWIGDTPLPPGMIVSALPAALSEAAAKSAHAVEAQPLKLWVAALIGQSTSRGQFNQQLLEPQDFAEEIKKSITESFYENELIDDPAILKRIKNSNAINVRDIILGELDEYEGFEKIKFKLFLKHNGIDKPAEESTFESDESKQESDSEEKYQPDESDGSLEYDRKTIIRENTFLCMMEELENHKNLQDTQEVVSTLLFYLIPKYQSKRETIYGKEYKYIFQSEESIEKGYPSEELTDQLSDLYLSFCFRQLQSRPVPEENVDINNNSSLSYSSPFPQGTVSFLSKSITQGVLKTPLSPKRFDESIRMTAVDKYDARKLLDFVVLASEKGHKISIDLSVHDEDGVHAAQNVANEFMALFDERLPGTVADVNSETGMVVIEGISLTDLRHSLEEILGERQRLDCTRSFG